MRASELRNWALGVGACASIAGCAELVGASFDVVPDDGTSSSSSSSTGGGGGAGGGLGPGVELLVAIDYASDIAVEQEQVYYTVWREMPGEGGGVYRVPADGSAEPVRLSDDAIFANRVLLHGSHVYWTETGSGPGAGRVQRVPKLGGDVETLAEVDYPLGLTVHGDALYFSSRENDANESVPVLDPIEPVAITDLFRVDLDPLGEPRLHARVPRGVGLLSADDTWIWGADLYDDVAVRVRAEPWDDGGGSVEPGEWYRISFPSQVYAVPGANGIDSTPGLTIVGSYRPEGGLYRVGHQAEAQLTIGGQAGVADVVLSGGRVYWANFDSDEIRSAVPVGGSEIVHARGQFGANGVAVDDGWIYFTCYAERALGGGVRRVRTTQRAP